MRDDDAKIVSSNVIFFRGGLSACVSRMSGMCGVDGKEEIRNWGINRTEIHKDNKKNCSDSSVIEATRQSCRNNSLAKRP